MEKVKEPPQVDTAHSLNIPDHVVESTLQKENLTATNTEEITAGNPKYLTGLKLSLVICAVTLCCFLLLLDTAIISTAIPKITSDFNSLGDIGWYGAAYLLSNAAVQPITGKVYSNFNAKYTSMGFLGVFELGSVICGAARNSNMLIVGRAIAGIGGAGIINGGLSLLTASAPVEKRPLHMGIMMGVGQVGIVLGPLVGGLLTQYASWRWCFLINLPIGAVAAITIFLIHIPDIRPIKAGPRTLSSVLHSLDLLGFTLFAGAILQLLLALQWGGSVYSWDSSVVIGLFCGFGVVIVLFGIWENKRGETAMFPLSMLKQRVVWCSGLSTMFFGGNLMISGYYMSLYFQSIKGVTPTLAGVYLLPNILSQIFFAVLSGALLPRVGYYLPWAVAGGALAAIGTGLIASLTPYTSTAKWVVFLVIMGTGRGCGMQMSLVAVQNHVSPAFLSTAMTVIIFYQNFGGTLFLALAQTIFSSSLLDVLPKFAPGVDAQAIIGAGAKDFRHMVDTEELSAVVLAFNEAINNVFWLSTACSIMVFICSWGIGWKSVKKSTRHTHEA